MRSSSVSLSYSRGRLYPQTVFRSKLKLSESLSIRDIVESLINKVCLIWEVERLHGSASRGRRRDDCCGSTCFKSRNKFKFTNNTTNKSSSKEHSSALRVQYDQIKQLRGMNQMYLQYKVVFQRKPNMTTVVLAKTLLYSLRYWCLVMKCRQT
jgi:hypothetical protein